MSTPRLLHLLSVFLAGSLCAQDAAPNAKDLAAQLSANLNDGASFVRLKLEVKQPTAGGKSVFQLQIKARRTPESADILYQVLYPKERKGEAVLLQRSGRSASAKVFTTAGGMQTLSASQLAEPIFGSDLAYADVVEDFFGWSNQALAGTGEVGRTTCHILESKPGKGDRSAYGMVRSWIDVKKLVPLRIEKYSGSGQLLRTIETTRVVKDDTDKNIPAALTVQRPGKDSVSDFEGTSNRHDVTYTDRDFSVEGMQVLTAPGG